MIYFNIRIANPFKYDAFKNYWQRDIPITKNKTFEIGFYKYAWDLFEFSVDLRWCGHDHAGPSLELNLLGFTGRIGISDNRHWNDVANTWE